MRLEGGRLIGEEGVAEVVCDRHKIHSYLSFPSAFFFFSKNLCTADFLNLPLFLSFFVIKDIEGDTESSGASSMLEFQKKLMAKTNLMDLIVRREVKFRQQLERDETTPKKKRKASTTSTMSTPPRIFT